MYGCSICYTRYIDLYLCFHHNPPHVHVRSGEGEFTITIKDRIVEGRAKSKTIHLINDFLDEHVEEIMELWDKAQRGETIKKVQR